MSRVRVDIGFSDHSYTNSGLQSITTPPPISTIHKSPQHKLRFPACSVYTSRSLITTSDSGDLQLPHSSPTWLAAPFQLTLSFTDSRRELTWLPQLSSLYLLGTTRTDNIVHSRMRIRCHGNMLTEPFPSSGRLFILIKNLLLNNGRRSVVCFAAVS
jgi:hypothetical protein